MARPLSAGALYHVTARGDRREDIYETDDDRQRFLSLLGEVSERFNWVCHAYCLMCNHYHLLIETPEGNLSKGMRQLNGVYTQRFNVAHDRVGHVFQGRYKAILVDKESYLLEVARYIVLNPIRAKMVRSVRDWPWSSYRATAGEALAPNCLTVDWLLSGFGKQKKRAIEKYKEFVAEGKGVPLWDKVQNQVFLGNDEFVEEKRKLIDAEKDLSEIPMGQKRVLPKSLDFFVNKTESRDEAIVAAYDSGGYSFKEIGEYFGLHYSRISRIVAKAKSKT